MATSGSRGIVVRGLNFRWAFKGPGASRWPQESPVRAQIFVQAAKPSRGKPLVVPIVSKRWLGSDQHDLDLGGSVHKATVSPRDISKIVEAALDGGWAPDSKEVFAFRAGLDLTDYVVLC